MRTQREEKANMFQEAIRKARTRQRVIRSTIDGNGDIWLITRDRNRNTYRRKVND